MFSYSVVVFKYSVFVSYLCGDTAVSEFTLEWLAKTDESRFSEKSFEILQSKWEGIFLWKTADLQEIKFLNINLPNYRIWSTGERNGKPVQYSCLENPMNSRKRQKYRTLKDELPRSVVAQYATGDQWRKISRKNEGMQPKQKQYPVVDGTGDGSKVWCCKGQYCIGTWNVRSVNQGKLEVVKQEMARVNIDILAIAN